MGSVDVHVDFTKKVVVPKIIQNNADLAQQKLLKVDVTTNDELNGFMSNILFLKLSFEDGNNKVNEYHIVVKLMKGSEQTRTLMRSDVQFANEISIYQYVLPAFLKKFRGNFKTIDKDLWCPRAYLAEEGVYPELGSLNETVLAVENVSPEGYRLGGRHYLSEAELKLMTQAIAQYHACSIALKVKKDPLINELKSHIVPLRFKSSEGRCLYDVLYDIAFDRLFEYLDATPEELDSEELRRNIAAMRKYEKRPLDIMEGFLEDDEAYSVILHGDYNRNNVLFKYDEQGNPINVRMIDFQEVRYGTPAIDLSFYFYMNMNPEEMKGNLFSDLVKHYHTHLVASLCELLECKEGDKILEPYTFENFIKHFNRFAFYGGMVSVHFLPWMVCPSDECERLTHLWFTDMNSPEFTKLAMTCGGKDANARIVDVLRMATRLGHMDIFH